jgi:molecular chaperone IbpA
MTINKIPYFDPFSFSKSAVGFDDMFKKLSDLSENLPKIPTYPPYNIKKVDDNKYVIEMAVAGFGRQDLELELQDGILTITGAIKSDEATEYLYKGIADRAFTRKFTLADTVEVKNADLINGMLKIWLERFIPEEKKPKKININGAAVDQAAQSQQAKSTQQFLSEKYDK